MVEVERAKQDPEILTNESALKEWFAGLITQLIKNEEGKVGPTLGLIIGLFILFVGSGLVETSFLIDNNQKQTGVITAVPTNPPVYQETYPTAPAGFGVGSGPDDTEADNGFWQFLIESFDGNPEVCFTCSVGGAAQK